MDDLRIELENRLRERLRDLRDNLKQIPLDDLGEILTTIRKINNILKAMRLLNNA